MFSIVSTKLFGKDKLGETEIIQPFINQKRLLFRAMRKMFTCFGLETVLINKSKLLQCRNDLIFFDGAATSGLLNWAGKNLKNKRLIFWYWNPISKSRISLSQIPPCFEVWSYSKSDCAKFHLKWNSTFMDWSAITLTHDESETKTDFVYIGRKKGQQTTIEALTTIFEENHFSSSILLTRLNPHDFKNRKLPAPLSYSDYIAFESRGNIIIDIGQNPGVGLTLRVLEAAFLKKKILCNYEEPLISLFPLQNIFFFKEDVLDSKELKEFVQRKTEEVNPTFFEYYSVGKWLGRFEN